MLSVQNLSKAFGGVKAVDDVSFDVAAGTIHALIGPNGAGKTTALNLLSGLYVPDSGRVRFLDHDVTGVPPQELARLGVSRTFQNLRVCLNMSALDNVLIGAHLRLPGSMLAAMLGLRRVRRADERMRAEARELMDFVGVSAYVDSEASQLPYGALKRLEVARALISRPKLLLLDEPAAGLNAAETGEITVLVRKLADSGITVVVVEHDMKLVMQLSDRIVVLDYGRKLAEGTPREVAANPEVIAAYLGTVSQAETAALEGAER